MGERMKNNKAWIFGVLAAVLAVTALLICLTQRSAEPKLFGKAEGAEECARAMMESISRGDYAGASAYLYGTPSLGTEAQRETPAAELIWNAFISSLECQSQGGCYATVSGIAMDFTVSSLDIPSLTQALKERSSAVLEARVEAAEDMSQVYDSDGQYREEFAKSVLEEAAREAVAASTPVQRTVTVQLVYDRNQWWVVPDEALLSAISGGII
ncbi:MAG: hypothetical protein ACI3XG_07905 [Faecousia sp.]